MPDPPTPSKSVDLDTIRRLVRLMHRYDLTAIDLGEGAEKIRLRRGSVGRAAGVAPAAPMPLPGPAVAAPPAAAPVSAPAAAVTPRGVTIDSPMVGSFYLASSPETPPFVSVGSAVRPDTTVCIIEAMKVFTDIPAGLSGLVTEILVKNGQAVEYGQPLFRVEPS